MLTKRGLDEGNNSICIGQKKERDTGTFLFNSVLKTGTATTKLTESTLGKGKTENDNHSTKNGAMERKMKNKTQKTVEIN